MFETRSGFVEAVSNKGRRNVEAEVTKMACLILKKLYTYSGLILFWLYTNDSYYCQNFTDIIANRFTIFG